MTSSFCRGYVKGTLQAYLLAACLLFWGCPAAKVMTPDPLQNLEMVSKALNDISIAGNAAVKGVLIVYPDNTGTRRQILGVLTKVVQADEAGIEITRSIATLSPADAQSLSQLLAPVFVQFHQAVDSGLLGFKTPEAKAEVQPWIDRIAVAIAIVEGILKGRAP